MAEVRVNVDNAGTFYIEKGTTLLSLLRQLKSRGIDPVRYEALGAKLNNQVRELSHTIDEDSDIRYIDLCDEDGIRIYRRSVHFVFIKALRELYPERKAVIKHAISKGIYFEVKGKRELTNDEVNRIRKRMRSIIREKVPFIRKKVSLEEAKKTFQDTGREDKFHIIEHREKGYVAMYDLGGTADYFYGYMVPHTGYLQSFHIIKYKFGVIIVFPDRNEPAVLPAFQPQPKLFEIIREHEIDGHLLGCRSLGDLNRMVSAGRTDELVEKSEYLHTMKIKDLALRIAERKHHLVFIAGPSSSGKTSTARRISARLNEMSVNTVTVSMDDYYFNKMDIPADMDGGKDLENITSVDIPLFTSSMADLLAGKEVMKPLYDFTEGLRKQQGELMRAGRNDVIIVEGIHGLNPLTYGPFEGKQLFRIYVSSLTSMNIDDHNRIPTTDTRLLRRLVRDRNYRNTGPEETLRMWPSVRRGEEMYIFPFQENADAVFNTSLYYELAILKPYADKMINGISAGIPEYSEARRLSEFLSNVNPSASESIPDDSIIREFIGGSILFRQ